MGAINRPLRRMLAAGLVVGQARMAWQVYPCRFQHSEEFPVICQVADTGD